MSGCGESLVTMVLGSFVTKYAYVETCKSVVRHSPMYQILIALLLCVSHTQIVFDV